MFKSIQFFTVLISVAFVLASCTKNEPAPVAESSEPVALPQIGTVVLAKKHISRQINCTGEIEPQVGKAVTIAPRFSGRVTNVLVTPGTYVSQGQKLAEIDSQDIGEMQAELIEAIAKLTIARSHEARERAIYNEEVLRPRALMAAQSEFDHAKVAYELAAHNYDRVSKLFAEKIAAAKDKLEAGAELAKTRVTMEQCEANLNREKTLFATKASIREDLQLAEAERERCREHVITIKQRLRSLGMKDDTLDLLCKTKKIVPTLPVLAPIAGIVALQHVATGEYVEAGQKLFYVCDLSTVSITSEVPESEMANLRPGLAVQASVSTYPKEKFAGTISYIGSQIDEKTRTVQVRVLVPNQRGRLKLNMFANVQIDEESKLALACPRTALHNESGETVVYIADDKGYARRAVTCGIDAGDEVEILSGLHEGEKVVTTGGVLVKTQLSFKHAQ